MGQHEIRDGVRIIRFNGTVVSRASSERPGVLRWSELTVYRTASGLYLLSKIGRTTVAHDPSCHLAKPKMPTYLEAYDEAVVHRAPCPTCQPAVGDEMDPHTVLEPQRYAVFQASNLAELRRILLQGRDPTHAPLIVRRVLADLQG